MDILNSAICDNPQLLLDDLGIEINLYNDHFSTNCIIHGGDKKTALNVYFNEYRGVRGRWICTTKGCHKLFINSIAGFARGVLSNRYCGWSKPGDKMYSWPKTLKYLKGLYGIAGEGRVNLEEVERQKFIRSGGYNEKAKTKIICTKERFLSYYSSPPNYFRERGFSDEVLEKYNVRYCDRPRSQLYTRCCIPVFDDVGRNVIGISARTTCNEEPKWRNTTNFPKGTNLYNYGFAREYIKRRKTAIIVEGPADVWRLTEAGINNCVAIWGNELLEHQNPLLNEIGVLHLVLALDNDEAGKEGMEKIKEDVKRLYNTTEVKLPDGINDIGDLTTSQVKELFKNI